MYNAIVNIAKIKKPILVVLIILAVAALSLFLLARQRNSNDQHRVDTDEKTTSVAETAQEDYSQGNHREPGSSLLENAGSAIIVDGHGSVDSSIDQSEPLISDTGQIMVYAPTSNTMLDSGANLLGKSSLDKVSYRLIDSVTGVISTGELKVVNGYFSGKINFTTSATEGRLDVFAVNKDFSEYSNVEIPINFR